MLPFIKRLKTDKIVSHLDCGDVQFVKHLK